MQVFPESAKEKLGFESVKKRLSQLAISESGAEFILKLQPLDNSAKIILFLSQTNEFKSLLVYDEELILNHFNSPDKLLSKISVEGSFLFEEELHKLRKWIETAKSIKLYFQKREEKYPELSRLILRMTGEVFANRQIARILDEDGHLRSDASPELIRIRRVLQEKNAKLRSSMDQILKMVRQNGWSEDQPVTFRNDRPVISIKADFKGKFEGFVQDVSASGQTVFVEPAATLAINNEIAEYKAREKNEIRRILFETTESIRPELPVLSVWSKVMMHMDVARAKAKLAIEMEASMPRINPESTSLDLQNARNPLLWIEGKKQKKEVIPLSFSLDKQKSILVISGPNAGGKSVALKTAGLLQMMFQSGLLVPADDHSEFPVLRKVFLDMGDEQSVQNDLSTYTSHLKNLKTMFDGLDAKSLFLIDEFGAGTDPGPGGAIAVALLEQFALRKAFGIVTTHFGEIKIFAENHASIINGAMLFNLETLKPAYKLEIGLPGSSYAFEIASMAGLPDFIIRRGQELAGKSQSALEELLTDLREKQEALRISLENARILEIKAKEKDTLQKSAHDEVQKAKRKILEDARIFASKMIADANVKIEATIKEIRDSNADKQVARQAKKNLEKTVESFEIETSIETPELEPEILQYNDIEGERPNTGDWVRIIGTETIGKIILENARDFTLALGGLRTNIKKSEVVKVKEQIEKVVSKGLVMDLSKASVFSPTIDIRGSRVEEALPVLNKFVDDARLSGVKNLRVIHGKGTGALRMAVLDWASGHLLIESAQEAHIDQGGAGATDLILKTN